MNFDFSLLIQIILLALIFYVMYAHFDVKIRVRFFRTAFAYQLVKLGYYLDYKVTLEQKDIESYHRYEIWRFYEKTKNNSQF